MVGFAGGLLREGVVGARVRLLLRADGVRGVVVLSVCDPASTLHLGVKGVDEGVSEVEREVEREVENGVGVAGVAVGVCALHDRVLLRGLRWLSPGLV